MRMTSLAMIDLAMIDLAMIKDRAVVKDPRMIKNKEPGKEPGKIR